ncbi:hypothetical protein BN77_p10489 [Rhizobium mesoamericanum STM3625]|uniref:Uncharacterized protein n=1 Tax=Rhizobium mesoamericanum STM3625 TaxID=1211777 RepID=K0Q362_9HYPH|nr:hypothetical protein BN77_p10489 [Rhizobium mesoamericanum STM3625]
MGGGDQQVHSHIIVMEQLSSRGLEPSNAGAVKGCGKPACNTVPDAQIGFLMAGAMVLPDPIREGFDGYNRYSDVGGFRCNRHCIHFTV